MPIRARAPLRLSFAGGGTDVPPYTLQEGGAVLSATIDRYAYGSLRPCPEPSIDIESVDLGLRAQISIAHPGKPVGDDKLRLVFATLGRFLPLDQLQEGFSLTIRSDAPPGSGLGSSSTLTVALVGLLREHLALPLTDYEIAELAHEIERHDLGVQGGYQDHYAAAFGGFNFIEFGETVLVNPLRVSGDVIAELQMSLLLVYTGITRQSTRILEDQTRRLIDENANALEGLRLQKRLAYAMKDALLRGKVREVGSLLDAAWHAKQKMSPLIATPLIQEAYEEALRAGALGGKVTGAGGGGHMMFFCDFERLHHVAERLESMGTHVTRVSFEPEGLKTWRSGW